MSKISLYILMVFLWFNTGWTEEINQKGTKFSISEISINDSLLKYFSKKEIKKNIKNFYKDKKFIVTVLTNERIKESYDYIQIHFKKNDKKFKVQSINGTKIMNYDSCLELQKKIDYENINKFKDFSRSGPTTRKHAHDKTGESKATSFFYIFNTGDIAEVSCYFFAEHMGYKGGLTEGISTAEFHNWLETKKSEY